MSWRTRLRSAWARITGQRSGYKAAQVNRLTLDWIASPIAANAEIKKDQRILRGRARDLAKNNSYVRQYLHLLVNNVIGETGCTMQAQVRNNDKRLSTLINDKIEHGWLEFCMRPGVKPGSLRQHERLALRNVAVDGEVFVALLDSPLTKYGLRIELIDCDRVDWNYSDSGGAGKPRIDMGVEFDAEGAPIAFHVWSQHPEDSTRANANIRKRIPAKDLLHIYDPDRIDQARGMTWLAAPAYAMNMLDGYIESELVAARTGAAKMGWFQWRESAEVETFDPQKDSVNLEANPGSIGFAPPGTEFKEWNPTHPSQAFPSFVKQMLRQAAAGLGVSYNALANDLENVNYSSIRSGLLVERDTWRDLQAWWRDMFLQPLFDRWLANALMVGALTLDSRDPARFREVKWMARGWEWVDPLKDAQAAVLQIEKGLDTRTNLLGEKGVDFEATMEQLQQEQQFIEQLKVELAPMGSTSPAPPGQEPATNGAADPSDSSVADEKGDDEDAPARSLRVVN